MCVQHVLFVSLLCRESSRSYHVQLSTGSFPLSNVKVSLP